MQTLATPSAPYPLIVIVSLNPAVGVLVFNWLDADGARVDSGGSVARFTPVTTGEGDSLAYVPPADAALIDAVTTPPAPVPEVSAELPTWRIRAVASLHELTPAIIAALAEPARTVATEVWQNGNTIRRDSALVAQLAAALGLTGDELDAYFIAAAALPT